MELVCNAPHHHKPQSFILIKDLTFSAGFDTIYIENKNRLTVFEQSK